MHTEAVTAKCSMARRPKKCLRKSYHKCLKPQQLGKVARFHPGAAEGHSMADNVAAG